MELLGEVYQFLSRTNIPNVQLGIVKSSPKQRPELLFSISYEICNKPFEINFAQVTPCCPSIGAHEYIDPYVDIYMERRWPKCIKGKAQIQVSSRDLQDSETIRNILLFLRLNVSRIHLHKHKDQFAGVPGYKREYFANQIFDISGNRRPSSSENYIATPAGDYIGPGLSFIENISPFENVNELVWSQIIPFPNKSDSKVDLPFIKEKALAIKKHYNSYNELNDAQRFLLANEIKACVRSAASAVDAILRYYCEIWNISFPTMQIPFDEKIEKILNMANKPSYKTAEPEILLKLLYLYRTRNSMHEGDCYYKDQQGNTVPVRTQKQATEFIDSAEAFTIWIDSIA
ncbi:hypothetical protein ARNL5_03145 [Anaerolineae bacterium]|nr:hypothetical protein ARNL5_03145 [Anaerolineae bacterium]